VAHDLTIVAIARDEARYILEWIAHHLVIGVDRIVVYDNESRDGTGNVVSRIANLEPRVLLRRWPSPRDHSPQVTAYNHALRRVDTGWIGFIDIDEFIVPFRDGGIGAFLSRVPDDVASVHLNWRGFGSGGRDDDGYDFVTTAFTACARARWSNNHHYKTLARTARAIEALVHDVDCDGGRRVLSDMKPFEAVARGRADRVAHDGIQLNHYQTKTWTEFQARMQKGSANFPADHPGRTKDPSLERFRVLDRNDEQDTRIARFTPAMIAEVARLKALAGL
jgi:glycosyltransferase involved in cell wall biosynthesis